VLRTGLMASSRGHDAILAGRRNVVCSNLITNKSRLFTRDSRSWNSGCGRRKHGVGRRLCRRLRKAANKGAGNCVPSRRGARYELLAKRHCGGRHAIPSSPMSGLVDGTAGLTSEQRPIFASSDVDASASDLQNQLENLIGLSTAYRRVPTTTITTAAST
jgi:hypothetical protein